ncbi:MAG: ferritin-like domain-containing protein [Bacteroidota bacterium]
MYLLHRKVADELIVVHQYLHFHGNHQRFGLPEGLFNKAAIEVMLPVEQPADRILFLGGVAERETSEKEKSKGFYSLIFRVNFIHSITYLISE